jgi:hypothetical protein
VSEGVCMRSVERVKKKCVHEDEARCDIELRICRSSTLLSVFSFTL